MAATNHDMKELEREAKRQGWKVQHSGSNHLRWTPPHGRAVMTSLTPSNNYAINMIERDLKRAGLKLGVEYEKREKPVPTVADLIKANGTGEPVGTPQINPTQPAPKRPYASRQDRTGMVDEILVVLKGCYPQEMDFTTLKMRVAMNYPGVAQSSMHRYLAELKAAGAVMSTRQGYYRAKSIDATLPTEAPVVPLEPILPDEHKQVIQNLLAAVAAAEKLIVKLTRQAAEQNEATETIKRLAARL